MNQNNRVKIPSIGGSSLLTIFTILCLIVFAVLALATVQADKRVFNNIKSSALAYYEADAKAQDILAQLRDNQKPDIADLINADNESTTWTYQIPVSDKTVLDCKVRIYYNKQYQCLNWALISTEPWAGDFGLPVFQN